MLSCSSSSGYFNNELKNELSRSEKRRSALCQSLRNACYALQHQKDCLQQQENYIANGDMTLEHLLQRQELLESRFSYLKHPNFSPGFINQDLLETKGHQSVHYIPVITDSIRITDLEREINDIKMKMRRHSLLTENNSLRWNLFEERKKEEAEYVQMQEELRGHAELLDAKCSNAQRERDALELEVTSLHSGLHQANVTSKELEKKCVKLQSKIMANRNINENLHLEVSALKNHSHTLENAVKASVSENKSLLSQIENLEQENQSLCSQKELFYNIMEKKGKKKHQCEERSKRATKEIQMHKHEDNSSMNPKETKLSQRDSLVSMTSCDLSLKNSRRPQKLRTKKGVRCKSKNDDSKRRDELQMVCDSKRPEMNTEIILACYQHLADLLRKLECILKSNVKLDKEKEQIFTFILGTVKELKDSNIASHKSREQVKELLNERHGLRENYHLRLNQITAVIIELKHLRQAYNSIFKDSRDLNDKDAMAWISRVQAIKDSLKLLKLHD